MVQYTEPEFVDPGYPLTGTGIPRKKGNAEENEQYGNQWLGE